MRTARRSQASRASNCGTVPAIHSPVPRGSYDDPRRPESALAGRPQRDDDAGAEQTVDQSGFTARRRVRELETGLLDLSLPRTTGTGAGEFAIVGSDWHGELPSGVEELRAGTNLVWVLGRTYCTGTPEDYAAVHAIQDQYKLMPLSAYGKSYTPPPGRVDPSIDMKTPPREQVERMDTISFFKLLAELEKPTL
jgi:hypothetical protein